MSHQFERRINTFDKVYLIFSTLMTTLLGLVLPFSILIIFDRILPNQSTDSLFLLFAFILISIACDYFLKTQEEKVTSLVMKRYESQLTNRVFNSICHANIAKFTKLEMGQYLERISAIPEIKSFFGGESIKALINTLTSVITVAIIFVINTGAGIALLAASGTLLIAARVLSRKRIALLEKRSDTEGMTNSKIIEIVSSPLEIKSRAMEYRFESFMKSMIEERESHSIEYERLESSFNLTLTLIQQLSVAVVVVMCAMSVINLEISQGVMAAVILLTNRYFSPYQQVMQTFSRWKLNQSYIKHVCELMDLEESSTSESHIAIGTISVNLKGHKFNLSSGTSYQFSGPTGSGKTYLTRSLTLEQPSTDIEILIDGTPISEIDYASWKQQVARIDRNSTLVEGTIIENLTCFRPHLNSAAYSLCENLGVKAQIDQLKSGFYTQLKGNMQNPFSRQVYYSLLIVRTLLSQKQVIVIDDFDMFFDKLFAQRVMACISNKVERTTCIVISNKLSQIRHKLEPIQFKATKAQTTNENTSGILERVL
ncbi:ATP-binding cassette domain-containing protein [Vibrio sp. SCSIO 43135]|uniref:ABC transporter transmembrane domain-containing protein n=1 Tax=Vibrio sp. SCSIO 43135 TaxID=2819096 RepID=UPI002076089D|nr:ABC transporter transmembrane domain-containing protein [Vibrio sp. SCSIO 43135]USD40037.1 ATP-binding cassette domain-containing protein [Vibrio sp. SCSIO 43135]